MEPMEFGIAVIGMIFVLVLLGGIFRFALQDDTRKAGVKLEIERERTHREIAAHVASGSLSPDDAERLILAMGQADQASINAARDTANTSARPAVAR